MSHEERFSVFGDFDPQSMKTRHASAGGRARPIASRRRGPEVRQGRLAEDQGRGRCHLSRSGGAADRRSGG